MRQLAAFLLGAALASHCAPGSTPAVDPKFEDITASAGLELTTPTFSAAFADVDNDGDDDLLVSRHGGGPFLYLQQSEAVFAAADGLLPTMRVDLHGMTVADLDNDGDKDLVLACGGDDGAGPGCEARVLENRLVQEHRLAFADVSGSSGLAELPAHRSRSYLPTASDDGSRIDLYLTGKNRPGFPNRLYRNVGDAEIRFRADPDSQLSESFDSEGRDVFFDHDRDGDQDLLLINNGTLVLFERTDRGFEPSGTLLVQRRHVSAVGVGDVDNDGYPDVFVGTSPRYGRSDRVSRNRDRIHFYVARHDAGDRDELRFKTDDRRIWVDFVVKPGLSPNDPSSIFLGALKTNPSKRRARITASVAEGAPTVDGPGTYIWHQPKTGEWHVLWNFEGRSGSTEERGSIRTSAISDVTLVDMESQEDGETEDILFTNEGGRSFRRAEGLQWRHRSTTVAAQMLDLNNDGFLDIVGIRANAAGDYNGEPFLLVNEGSSRFRDVSVSGLETPDDDLSEADQLTAGFANQDGRVDLFLTHGGGLNPGNQGPYKLYANVTRTGHHYVLLSLVGTRSNRDALGAQVELRNRDGELIGYREVGAGWNRSQISGKLHFGLGELQEEVLARIRWPSGRVTERAVPIDTTTQVSEPGGEPESATPRTLPETDRFLLGN